MNKDLIKRLIVVAAILALATASLVAGTFAKYTTEIEGTATARVAKFDVKAMGANASANAEFKLFDTILDTLGGSEQNVKPGEDENIIAPGTQGSFDIKLENNSEVTVQYAIAFTEDSDLEGVPLEFRIYEKDGTVPTDWETTLSGLNIGDATTVIAFDDEDDGERTYTVDWRWPFEKFDGSNDLITANDVADTALGKAETLAKPTVTATVTFTQVD